MMQARFKIMIVISVIVVVMFAAYTLIDFPETHQIPKETVEYEEII